jgi:hypothetical protein
MPPRHELGAKSPFSLKIICRGKAKRRLLLKIRRKAYRFEKSIAQNFLINQRIEVMAEKIIQKRIKMD